MVGATVDEIAILAAELLADFADAHPLARIAGEVAALSPDRDAVRDALRGAVAATIAQPDDQTGLSAAVRCEALTLIGTALSALDDGADAVRVLSRALELCPADVAARLLLAEVLAGQGDFEGACFHGMRAAAALLDLGETCPVLTPELARAVEDLALAGGKGTRAAAVLRAAYPPLPSSKALEASLSVPLEELAPLAWANPGRIGLHRLAVEKARQGKDEAAALPHLAAIAAAQPDDVSSRVDLAQGLRRAGRLDEAEAVLTAILAHDPDHPAAALEHIQGLSAHGQGARALQAADDFLARNPTAASCHLARARLLLKENRYDEAAASARRAVDHAPEDPEGWRILARILWQSGDHVRAIDALRDALSVKSRNPAIARLLGTALASSGRFAEAIPWLRRILARDPDDAAIRRTLGTALMCRDRWAEGWPLLGWPEQAPGAPFAADLPSWEGGEIKDGVLLLVHGANDEAAPAIIGVGLARALAAKGIRVAFLLPRRLLPAAARCLPEAPRAALDDQAGAAKLAALKPVAWAPLARLPVHLGGGGSLPTLNDWPGALRQPPKRGKAGARRWLLIRPDGAARDVPGGLPVAAGERLDGPVDECSDADPLLEVMAAITSHDAVLCCDGAGAALAGSLGRPGVVLLSAQSRWWWSDGGAHCPRFPQMWLARTGRSGEHGPALEVLDRAIAADLAPPPPVARITLPGEDAELADSLDRVAHLLPVEDQAPTPTPLSGGSRNTPLRFDFKDRTLVLRPPRIPARIRMGYRRECLNMPRAAEAGVAPALHMGDVSDGLLLTGFVDGAEMTPAALGKEDAAMAAAAAYRVLHGLGGFVGAWDTFAKVEANLRKVQAAGHRYTPDEQEVLLAYRAVRDALRANEVPAASCHNDPTPPNLFLSGGRMVLIDWECSSMADPHWEIAALATQAEMPDHVRDAFYGTYFGSEDHPAICRTALYEDVCRVYWWAKNAALSLEGGEDEDADGERIAYWQDEAGAWLRAALESVNGDRFRQAISAAKVYRWRG